MNFQELMSKASANNTIASKQLTKTGHKHKDSVHGVSNFAVKAFLARKEEEQKKKQADEEAARRARIQARLHQNLKTNQGKKHESESMPKSSFLNPPYAQEGNKEEKSTTVKYKKDDVTPQHQKSGASSKSSISDMKSYRSATRSNMNSKNSKRISKEKYGKGNNFVVSGKKNETLKTKKKLKTLPTPPNFKDLLAIAEQNKSGLKRMKRKTETVTCESKVEASKVKMRHGGGEDTLTEIDGKNMNNIQIKRKGKVKEKAVAKARGKQTASQWKSVVEPDRIRDKNQSHPNEGSKTLKRTRDSDTLGKNIFDKQPSKSLSYYARPHEPQRRMSEQNSYYPGPTYDNYYDEEDDSGLDGFIDDGEDEMCVEQTDVSKYIKEIFGYDRQRYTKVDDDDFAMESNYGQIEREERRSAKIAKLEDEIEILKEQADLKKQRDKLKKSKKPRK